MNARLAAAVAAGLMALIGSGCAKSGQTPYSATNATASVVFGNAGRGAAVYAAACAQCHGPAGAGGGIGPVLIGEDHRKNYEATVAWIEQPAPPMPQLYPSALTQQNVRDVATYVQSL